MMSQFERIVKQLRVSQQKVQFLVEQLHTLTILSVGDYVTVTRILSGRTVAHSGYVQRIQDDSIFLGIADGSTVVIHYFIALHLTAPPNVHEDTAASDSEWSGL